ncbi:MAG: hypothetical protein FVQ78_02870 [Solirubrobacterales bacterium]|nr:hypothetical protein [Solirubrobacterales bacterium]
MPAAVPPKPTWRGSLGCGRASQRSRPRTPTRGSGAHMSPRRSPPRRPRTGSSPRPTQSSSRPTSGSTWPAV